MIGSIVCRPVAVVFDLDDTLFPERTFVDCGFRAVARFLAPIVGQPADALAERLWELHARDGRGRLFDTLLAELGVAPDEDLVLACLLIYRTCEPRLEPSPGAVEMLAGLRAVGVQIGLISDGHAAVQRRKLAALPDVTALLDVVVLTDELGRAHWKPSPVPFRVACRLLGVAPTRAAYVGNDTRKDFDGARRAGLLTIRIGSRPDEGGATMDTVAVHSESDGDEPDGGDADMVVGSFGALTAALMGMQPPDPETRR